MEKKIASPAVKSHREKLSQSEKELLMSVDCSEIKGLNSKHLLLFHQLFGQFSSDGKKVMSAIEFFKMSKVMKLYPVSKEIQINAHF